MRDLGVVCSIDDFGTGFSGLSCLADMPIDSLKIDQSFVSRIRELEDDAPIVEAIIGMARACNSMSLRKASKPSVRLGSSCARLQRHAGLPFCPPQSADDIAQLLLLDDSNTIDWLGGSVADFGRTGSAHRGVAFVGVARVALQRDHARGRTEEIATLSPRSFPPKSRPPCLRQHGRRRCASSSGHSRVWSPDDRPRRRARPAAPVELAVRRL
jgi:hypothetical protein